MTFSNLTTLVHGEEDRNKAQTDFKNTDGALGRPLPRSFFLMKMQNPIMFTYTITLATTPGRHT